MVTGALLLMFSRKNHKITVAHVPFMEFIDATPDSPVVVAGFIAETMGG